MVCENVPDKCDTYATQRSNCSGHGTCDRYVVHPPFALFEETPRSLKYRPFWRHSAPTVPCRLIRTQPIIFCRRSMIHDLRSFRGFRFPFLFIHIHSPPSDLDLEWLMATGVVPHAAETARNGIHYQAQASLGHDQYSNVAAEGVNDTTRADVAEGSLREGRGGCCQVGMRPRHRQGCVMAPISSIRPAHTRWYTLQYLLVSVIAIDIAVLPLLAMKDLTYVAPGLVPGFHHP